jgi:tryptophan synthase alpha chain
VLVVDLPPEEAHDHVKAMRDHGIDTIFLASPTTTEARLKRIGELSRGFVYYVSRLGVTGAQRELPPQLADEVQRVRKATSLPVAVGFGISTGEHARAVGKLGDGVVVGSAFVDRIAKAKNDEDRVRAVKALAKEIVAGARA